MLQIRHGFHGLGADLQAEIKARGFYIENQAGHWACLVSYNRPEMLCSELRFPKAVQIAVSVCGFRGVPLGQGEFCLRRGIRRKLLKLASFGRFQADPLDGMLRTHRMRRGSYADPNRIPFLRNHRQMLFAGCFRRIGNKLGHRVAAAYRRNPMTELIPNTTEAAGEKHLPVVSQEGNTIRVCVGSAAHPMSTEHSIQWICLESAEGCQLKKLSPDTAPEAEFSLTQGDAPKAAYAYCNLHGLWKTEF